MFLHGKSHGRGLYLGLVAAILATGTSSAGAQDRPPRTAAEGTAPAASRASGANGVSDASGTRAGEESRTADKEATAGHGGNLTGVVRDPSGDPLPGVRVEATGKGAPRTAFTGERGEYGLDLSEGSYQVAFRLMNFTSVVKKGVRVAAGGSKLDVTMPLTATADIVVTGKRTFRNLADLQDPEDLVGVADAATEGIVTPRQIDARPARRAADVLETVPGVVISQHSGEGKANQYYLRGFNLDHGTDLSISVDGLPVNMPTHAHGQGYADLNFLIPELVSGIQYKKGPYYAEEGDFSGAGAVHIRYANELEHSLARLEGGELGYRRALLAASPQLGSGHLLAALEVLGNDGPWVHPDGYRRLNGIVRYSLGDERSGFSVTAMGYDGKWDSTDQVPRRAIEERRISRFGLIDPTDGGKTHRYSLSADWQHSTEDSVTRASAYALDYRLRLWSDFTYFLDDPVNGDQFEQYDDRRVYGLRASHQWVSKLGGVPLESVVGLQLRRDDIGTVGLYHTRARERLSTTREDSVLESGGALYAQSTVSWTEKVRLLAGLRGDLYRFEVDSDRPENSGTDTEALLSPKLGLALGPWARTELYVNAGSSFHSNDARGATITVDPGSGEPAQRVDPLVRAQGAELGVRSNALPHTQATVALWGLDIDSELLFIGDAGSTEASRPSRRTGVEASVYWTPRPWLTLNADLGWSRARFRDEDPAGDRIPGAVEGVLAAGASVEGLSGFSGGVQLRYFGPRPLIEDNSIRSDSSTLVNGRIGYDFLRRWRVSLDVLNILDAKASDVDYYYPSRLQDEPAAGVEDIHTHPVEPRAARLSVSAVF